MIERSGMDQRGTDRRCADRRDMDRWLAVQTLRRDEFSGNDDKSILKLHESEKEVGRLKQEVQMLENRNTLLTMEVEQARNEARRLEMKLKYRVEDLNKIKNINK